MMERNVSVKPSPQRWQDRALNSTPLDVVLAFETKVFELVVQDLRKREAGAQDGEGTLHHHPCLVVNLEVRDSTTEAASAAPQALLLCQLLEESEDWESEVEGVLDRFVEKTGRKRPQYDVCFC